MAAASILTRSDRALGIMQRHEAIPLDDYPGYFSVRDTITGSGRLHIATWMECDCLDFTWRDRPCKHIMAVRETETALLAYAAAWDAQAGPPATCPACGADLVCQPYHVGGRGDVHVIHCAAEQAHYSRRV
jgi:hypothetical protein